MSNKHIMMIEFTRLIANIDIPMMALYNETRISEKEVRKKIVDGTAEHSDFIVMMFKSQYENLKDLVKPNPQEEKDLYEDLVLEQQGGII